MSNITEEQFVKALEISTLCARKGWKHSTDMLIAKKIGTATDKEKTLQAIKYIVERANSEEEALRLIKDLDKNC